MGRFVLILGISTTLAAFGQDLQRAENLYQHTDYSGSLKALKVALNGAQPAGAEAFALAGRDYYMLGDYKDAVENLRKAVDLEPRNSDYALWLGRAWGRKAENASALAAPFAANKARQNFEQAVALNPRNKEATGDLLDYYLNAPGFLGGGLDKADALAKQIGRYDPAEGHYAAAQIADRRKQYATAASELRRAAELDPRQVARALDLASYLAAHGQMDESEAILTQAGKMAPDDARILYARAKIYIEERRNLEQAKAMLQKYLQSNLTPQDPPRQEARKLLERVAAGA